MSPCNLVLNSFLLVLERAYIWLAGLQLYPLKRSLFACQRSEYRSSKRNGRIYTNLFPITQISDFFLTGFETFVILLALSFK